MEIIGDSLETDRYRNNVAVLSGKGKKGKKAIPLTGREGHRVARRRGYHIFSGQSNHKWQQGFQPQRQSPLTPPGRFLALISDRG
jgi:hypothetical protein